MLFCLPATHVDAHLGNYGLRVLDFDTIDSCKVHARDATIPPRSVLHFLRQSPLHADSAVEALRLHQLSLHRSFACQAACHIVVSQK
jgi:hypothetical protein